MKILDDEMKQFREKVPELAFHEIMRQARDTLGLMQYRAAEFLNLRIYRLKNLESGIFRQPLPVQEFDRICEFYELPRDVMRDKMDEHLKRYEKSNKVRVLADGSSSVYTMQKDER